MNRCKVWWCEKPYYANGYCKAHLVAFERFGSPYGKKATEFGRIDEVISIARDISSVALAVAESKGICPFCGAWIGKHEENCISNLCKILLESTSRVSHIHISGEDNAHNPDVE